MMPENGCRYMRMPHPLRCDPATVTNRFPPLSGHTGRLWHNSIPSTTFGYKHATMLASQPVGRHAGTRLVGRHAGGSERLSLRHGAHTDPGFRQSPRFFATDRTPARKKWIYPF